MSSSRSFSSWCLSSSGDQILSDRVASELEASAWINWSFCLSGDNIDMVRTYRRDRRRGNNKKLKSSYLSQLVKQSSTSWSMVTEGFLPWWALTFITDLLWDESLDILFLRQKVSPVEAWFPPQRSHSSMTLWRRERTTSQTNALECLF